MGVNHSRLEVTPALPAKEQVVDGVCYVVIKAFCHLYMKHRNAEFTFSLLPVERQLPRWLSQLKKLMTNRLTLTDKQTA